MKLDHVLGQISKKCLVINLLWKNQIPLLVMLCKLNRFGATAKFAHFSQMSFNFTFKYSFDSAKNKFSLNRYFLLQKAQIYRKWNKFNCFKRYTKCYVLSSLSFNTWGKGMFLCGN